MAQAAKKKVVVCGGNGFLGSRICRAAVARGWDVTSISRSGEPAWSSVTSSPNAPPWSTKVSWQKGNILDPSSYTSHLASATAVIHTMGILLEADYKGVLRGTESPISGLRRAFSTSKLGSTNPLSSTTTTDGSTSSSPSPLRSLEPDGQITYELMNRDSAIALAQVAQTQHVPTFVYISAAAGAPVLPARYISTKRAAEETVAREFPSLRSVFFRPGFLYDSSRAFTMPLAAMTGLGALANGLVGGRLTWLMGAGGTKPLKADLVADAVVEAIEGGDVSGPVEVPQIEALATKAWRRGML